MSVEGCRWSLAKAEPELVRALAAKAGVSRILAEMLLRRGVEDADHARRFLEPAVDQLHSPWLLKDMEQAVERLDRGLRRNEKILVHGDYDADGILGSVILVAMLRRLGGDVDHHIPDRFTESYGVSLSGIEKARGRGCRLMVTADCGVSAADQIEKARALGIDTIVTDHHEPSPDRFPTGTPVIDPKRRDCPYPDKQITGAAVAMKLMQALMEHRGLVPPLESMLKMAGIGTITDVVPLRGENRVIAALGLVGLRDPRNPGLKALLKVSGVKPGNISARQVAFQVGPRLNAAGRMEHSDIVMELFFTSDAGRAAAIASRLQELNETRQKAQDRLIETVLAAAPGFDPARERIFIAHGDGWHRGLIGIAASKVRERYNVPCILISVEEGNGRGSGRSIPGFDLFAALGEARDILAEFGGHEQAAGLSLDAKRIDEFEARMRSIAASRIGDDMVVPELVVDAVVSPGELTPGLVEELERLAPFGRGNPVPVLAMNGVALAGRPVVVGRGHLKTRLRLDNERTVDAVYWNAAGRLPAVEAIRENLSVAFRARMSEYSGSPALEVEIRDLSDVPILPE